MSMVGPFPHHLESKVDQLWPAALTCAWPWDKSSWGGRVQDWQPWGQAVGADPGNGQMREK
jgi:hypothetical protein